MKTKLSFVMTLALLILFCAPGIRGDINPFFKPQLSLPSLSTQQAPVVYSRGYGRSSFGIKLFGGISLGSMRISDIENTEDFDQYKSFLRDLAGGIGFVIGGQVGVEVDIMYVQKGVKLDAVNADANGVGMLDFDISLVINQISIPVLLRFKLMPGTAPYFLLGGAVSYILSATADYNWSIGDENDTGSEDLFNQEGDVLNRLDYSIIGGAGLELAMGRMRLFFEGRYIYGLANILHDDAADAGDWMKLSTILILAGFGF